MADLKRFLAESPVAAKVTLPAFVVLQRLTLNPSDVGRIIEESSLASADGTTCELEVGGQCIAKGKIVRRRGRFFFKVTRMAEGGAP